MLNVSPYIRPLITPTMFSSLIWSPSDIYGAAMLSPTLAPSVTLRISFAANAQSDLAGCLVLREKKVTGLQILWEYPLLEFSLQANYGNLKFKLGCSHTK